MAKKILLAGESWHSYTVHVKGFDAFYTNVYEEGADRLIQAVKDSGYALTYMPSHEAALRFPFTVKELSEYDCVILSDIGSNTLLLHPDTFAKSKKMPNRCQVISDYVKAGGALLMVGGYMSFSGIDAKAKYGRTPLQQALPVLCLETDDLMEHPEGITPTVDIKNHPSLADVPADWPHFLGYNRTLFREEAQVVMRIGPDPFLAFMEHGKGRAGAFTSDCAPHWGPPEFVNWAGYTPLFKGILRYLTREAG